MTCKNCFYDKVCPHIFDADARKCRIYLDCSKVIVLPMNTTGYLHQELTEYCNNRCIEEL